ncbi:PHP domain-containing protein [candidate division KSB1 bacterium]|nr:PHP domain-containing protein [candidate division KSB1 bacterium]
MPIITDFHLHTHDSCDEASLEIPDLIEGAKAKGIASFGITDHLHTSLNLPDIAA